MYVRQRLIWCFVPLIILFSVVNDALASCVIITPGPPCVEYWQADAIFIGVANRVEHIPNNTGLAIGPYIGTTVHFTIEEAFKGVGVTGLVLDLDYCGHRFKEGERYLVYAHRKHNSEGLDVRAGSTRTRPLSEAAEDLQYIRGLASTEPGSRVFGKVTQFTYYIRKHDHAVEPLQDIKIVLEGNNNRQEALTDSQGRYEFRRLPAGTYRVRAKLPTYLSYEEQKIEVDGFRCGPVNIFARYKGEITGRVFDSNGKTLNNVPISLVPADASPEEIFKEVKDKVVWPFVLTTREGRFSFSQLPRGRYLLVINRTEYERRGRSGEPALPRFFYPGVSDAVGATVIVVGNEDERREYDFHLPIP